MSIIDAQTRIMGRPPRVTTLGGLPRLMLDLAFVARLALAMNKDQVHDYVEGYDEVRFPVRH